VALRGEVDIALEESLDAVRSFLAHSTQSDVAICLHDVTFLDSTGLEFLVRVQAQARAAGRTLRLVAPSTTAIWVLRISGLLHTFDLDPSPGPGLAACACRSPQIDGVHVLAPAQRVPGRHGMDGATG
jgi:anti-anti-sigma factor